MIATIKFEWRKLRFRPAFFVSAGLIAALVALVYFVSWYQALHPGTSERGLVNILTLYPAQFVNQVIGAGAIGGAIAIVLGAIYAGSEFSWGTLKTMFTQRPGRLTVWAGRVLVFSLWMAIMAAVLLVAGAAMSVVVALFQGAAIPNSPQHTGAVRLLYPLVPQVLSLSTEAVYGGPRHVWSRRCSFRSALI